MKYDLYSGDGQELLFRALEYSTQSPSFRQVYAGMLIAVGVDMGIPAAFAAAEIIGIEPAGNTYEQPDLTKGQPAWLSNSRQYLASVSHIIKNCELQAEDSRQDGIPWGPQNLVTAEKLLRLTITELVLDDDENLPIQQRISLDRWLQAYPEHGFHSPMSGDRSLGKLLSLPQEYIETCTEANIQFNEAAWALWVMTTDRPQNTRELCDQTNLTHKALIRIVEEAAMEYAKVSISRSHRLSAYR